MLKSLIDAKNWRIGTKIFAGFGSVIILLVLLSGFGSLRAVFDRGQRGASEHGIGGGAAHSRTRPQHWR